MGFGLATARQFRGCSFDRGSIPVRQMYGAASLQQVTGRCQPDAGGSASD
jgi:hypothetical protein